MTRRQQQLAKHSPCGVIELAYLSALLERRQGGYQSKRFKAIEKFFESAVSVVPLESLFHAIANAKTDVSLECCKIFSSCSNILRVCSPSLPVTSMQRALSRLSSFLEEKESSFFLRRSRHGYELQSIKEELQRYDADDAFILSQAKESSTKLQECQSLVEESYFLLNNLMKFCKWTRTEEQHPPYTSDLEVIYPSADGQDARKRGDKCFKAPMTLLTEGRKELNHLSEELVAEHSSLDTSSSSNTNIKMLSILQDLRKEFQTCSTLLGAFMESQVKIPLERDGGDKYVNKFAKHATTFGLPVWGLLILPFEYLNSRIIGSLSEDFRQFVVEFSHHVIETLDYVFPPRHQFRGYDERLEFLVGSMKQSSICNQNYVSYSLERQLEDQCKKRYIYHNTPVDEILKEWNDHFENERLTLVPDQYRLLVARWIKWSLMINNLRESLASQTAVGVIGLVNSGKSKFVRSLFGKEVSETFD